MVEVARTARTYPRFTSRYFGLRLAYLAYQTRTTLSSCIMLLAIMLQFMIVWGNGRRDKHGSEGK